MFEPKYLKEGKMLLKGVRKFIRYKRDLISSDRMEMIDAKYAEFEQALKDRDGDRAEKLAKELTTVCEKSVSDYRSSAWAENVEVVFVAIVIALGVRAYLLQPFKIPTGSMQPTLNGVIAFPADSGQDFSMPGRAGRIWDGIVPGRTWVDLVAEDDDEIVRIEERTRMKFWTSTRVVCASGRVYKAPVTWDKLLELGLGQAIGGRAQPDQRVARTWYPASAKIRKGQVLARGHVDTGDQVLVDKFSYHFRNPRRGDVFVFTTKNIRAISGDSHGGSQHYIKRLVAVPGDEVRVQPPLLYIDGEVASEAGMRRVMEKKDGYPGYSGGGRFLLRQPGAVYELALDEFWAMGDNSPHSSDSREWGPVPRANLVGPALVVYWPFTSHWGKIN